MGRVINIVWLPGDPGMPEERRNSQPFPKQNSPKRIFGSLPNILESFTDKEQPKRPKWMRHQKKLSQGEEKIMESLHEMYKEIDPEKPDSMLSSEQAIVKKLKTLYENDSTAYKPIAPRRKHELAISKPLLKSVYANPKLESIAKDPKLRTLDSDRFSWMGQKRFSDDLIGTKNTEVPESFISYLQESPKTSPKTSSIKHQDFLTDIPNEFPLRRYSSKEDLSGIAELESFKHSFSKSPGKRSSMKSIQSDTSSNNSQKKRVSFDEKRNSCVVIKEFLSYESLEDIYSKIDPKVPEEQLNKEQRFALRLKTSMDNLGRKPELRKRPTFKKSSVVISSPLRESVLRNTKLLSIIKDPIVKTAGEDTEQETVELRKVHRMKKYLGDINRVLRNPSKIIRKTDSRLSRSLEDFRSFSYTFKRISSSMENLPSEGIEPKIEIKVVTKILPAKSFAASFNVSSSSSSVDNSVEELDKKSEDTPVVFIEHFESESRSTSSSKVPDEGVQIKDISEENRKSDCLHYEQMGRVSFPEEEGEVCKMRLLSINSVEMEEEDDVLARYRRISEFKEQDSDKESFKESIMEDSQSFYSVELKTAEELTDEEDWLTKCLDQSCDIEDRKENRKMRVLYKDVVKEIKRKYNQDPQSSNESSEDEDIHIFHPKDGKIEVRRLSEDEQDKIESSFFNRFFKTNRSLEVGYKTEQSLIDEVPNTSLEKLNPSKEEKEYIMNVREMYKEEFEDIDRLGYADVEYDHHNKLLCRQNALEVVDSKKTVEEIQASSSSNDIIPERSVYLSKNEQKLLSTLKKRDSRPLSDINMDDLAFIESMKDKYLKGSDCNAAASHKSRIEDTVSTVDHETQNSDASSTSIHSNASLRSPTELFLLKGNEHYFNEIDIFARKESKYSSEIELTSMPIMKKQYSLPLENDFVVEDKFSRQKSSEKSDVHSEGAVPSIYGEEQKFSNIFTNHSYNYVKNSTRNFPMKEIQQYVRFWDERLKPNQNFVSTAELLINEPCQGSHPSTKYNPIEHSAEYFKNDKFHSNQKSTAEVEPKETDITISETNYENLHLRYLTSNFLTHEINNNTFFKLASSKYPVLNFQTFGEFESNDSMSKLDSEECRAQKIQLSEKICVDSSIDNLDPLDTAGEKFSSKTEIKLSRKSPRSSSESSSWQYFQPVYANAQELTLHHPKNSLVIPRKPKPLPRKSSRDSRTKLNKTSNADSMPQMSDNVTVVKVKNEPQEEPLPNSCKVMDECNDTVETISKACKVPQDRPTSSGRRSDDAIVKTINALGSSNVMVRKTKKFIKDGDLVEEFDEAKEVYNIRLDEIMDSAKFDTKSQVIPETLIDYADSESKITLFDNELGGLEDFQESCSRPQTSRQRSTPFRLSYYGENSEEGTDCFKEATSRTSKENVTRLKQKFENLSTENDEPERKSVTMSGFRETQKTNLAELLNEKAAYDLVFKTESKYWFDNSSETDRLDSTILTLAPSFETNEKPLNITILDPIESKTNSNYKHLFENDPLIRPLKKPFVGNVKLSELNLKTSIPCVDFTILNSPMVERESNASLYNFGLGGEGNSSADGASCTAKEE